jgi:hypothetical protein
MILLILNDWDDYVLLDVFKQGLNEGCADLLDSTVQPYIIM